LTLYLLTYLKSVHVSVINSSLITHAHTCLILCTLSRKRAHDVFAHNFDICQPIFIILADVHYRKFAKTRHIINPPNSFSITALPCKISIAILVTSSLLKRRCCILATSLSVFVQISQFLKDTYLTNIAYNFHPKRRQKLA